MAIVLDTNVLSNLMRDVPDAAVLAWLDRQPNAEIWTSSITVFELRRGVDAMPEGRKRSKLTERMHHMLDRVLDARIIDVDRVAADFAGRLWADRTRRGAAVTAEDTLIAGIVLAHRATLATRNLRHFPEVPTVDPWTA